MNRTVSRRPKTRCVGVRAVVACALVLALAGVSLRPALAERVNLLALGDSLVQGYGLPRGESFPEQLEAALREAGHDVAVTNAGSSGDTSETGAARLDWVLRPETDAVIVVLGANDALRGIDPAVTRQNLESILSRLHDRGIPTLLAGMKAPRNLGRDYVRAFDGLYPALAKSYDVVFYPFFLAGVAQKPELNQDDGIHPNARGVARIVSGILPKVETLIARARAADPEHDRARGGDGA